MSEVESGARARAADWLAQSWCLEALGRQDGATGGGRKAESGLHPKQQQQADRQRGHGDGGRSVSG